MLQDRDLLSVQEARDMVRKARVAFEAAKLLSQEQIDKIVKAMSDVAYAHSEELAKMAAEETSMGKYEDKIIKNHLASKAVYEAIKDNLTQWNNFRFNDSFHIFIFGSYFLHSLIR